MMIAKSFKNFLGKKYAPLYGLFILIFLTFAGRTLWIFKSQKKFEGYVENIARQIESGIVSQKTITESQVLAVLQTDPRVAYFSYYNQLDKHFLGFMNAKFSETHLKSISKFMESHSKEETLKKIVETPDQFRNNFIHLVQVPVYQTMKNTKVKVGEAVAGFLLPGYMPALTTGPYYDSLYKGWLLLLASHAVFYPLYLRRRKKFSLALSNRDQLEWLEQKLEEEADDDTTRENIVQKVGWIELFNQKDLLDWKVKGEWYVKEQQAIGFPWGGSIVTQYDIPFEKYEFEVEGQRMSGHEGFIVLFRFNGTQLIWVIGGWKNTRSEVIGYSHTVSNDKLEKFRWYYVKLESDSEQVVGFLDGRKVWEIKKKDIQSTPQDMGFQNGFGVGVWSSMARFQRIRIVSTE